MSGERRYYLGRLGQSFGPYTQEQFDRLLAEGTLRNYSWFWDSSNGEWQPIDPPPAHPEGEGRPRSRGAGNNARLQAVCHDLQSLSSGKLDRVTEVGCDFVTEEHASSPRFGSQARIFLDILDPDSGKAMTVTARIVGVQQHQGRWRYQLQWSGCPDICSAA